jgi:hypothetical protein
MNEPVDHEPHIPRSPEPIIEEEYSQGSMDYDPESEEDEYPEN